MTDRELLEAAAKAAGIDLQTKPLFGGDAEPGHYVYPPGNGEHTIPQWMWWNPLTDDGDALRLAVKLRMCVETWGSGAAAVVTVNNRALVAEPHYGDDPERATRRAIVRAAAAMGEKA